MSRILYLGLSLVLLAATPAAAQITVTAPANGTNTVAAANDFATTVLQDPWDMSQNTDGGWFVHSVDFPPGRMVERRFLEWSFWRRRRGTGDASQPLAARNGICRRRPSGTIRPQLSNRRESVSDRVSPAMRQSGQWRDDFRVDDEHDLRCARLAILEQRLHDSRMQVLHYRSGDARHDRVRTLDWDQALADARAGRGTDWRQQRQLDWVRLVENQPSLSRTITWSGTGPVDIYLDNNNAATSDPNQTLGLVASGVNGTSYSLNVGALAPGDYYVAIRRTGTTGNFSYSPGFYRVNAPATITVTSPSDEGSDDDFATVHLNNAVGLHEHVGHRSPDQCPAGRNCRGAKCRNRGGRAPRQHHRIFRREHGRRVRFRNRVRATPNPLSTRCTRTFEGRLAASIRRAIAS